MTGAFAGLRAVVAGFGVSGRAAVSVLAEEGASVLVTESRSFEEIQALAMTADEGDAPLTVPPGVTFEGGGHRNEHLDGADVLVVSPGVPEHAPIVQRALSGGIPVWSELEIGARLCRAPIVAVTGTNGKTTTVELIASMMRTAGLTARACGNVGYPFSLAAHQSHDALAVEASSFQLRFHHSLHPKVSVLLNLAEDHLDWHGSFEAYADAKARIFALQSPPDVHIGNRDDPRASQVSDTAPCAVRWFRSGPPHEDDVGVVDDHVIARIESSAAAAMNGRSLEGEIDLGTPRSRAPAFVADAAAAAAAALAFGIPADPVRDAIASFTPLPHRGAVVAEVESVRFIDDSKATNPHAALAALDGLDRVVLIAGGLAKGVDLRPLAQAAPHLSSVVAIGEAAPAIAEVFHGLVPVELASSLEEAVEIAFERAPRDGSVVLAPACASQDMFRDYRERGLRFAAAAASVAREAVTTGGSMKRRPGHGE
ncbi:MAG: UDP-N-acetylmuramoyl-L-alanine--D-glutamate ligase [Actinomycetota bacterium]|nr:UDP-N-acetylmuramoyl-L-alanine--D-glutamate ligase [Actinomycetota bacterium]